MTTKKYQIDGLEIENLIEICKRDGNAPAYIELELGKILALANDLGSLIKLRSIQYYLMEKKIIKKEEVNDYYSTLIKGLDIVGEGNKEIKEASLPLKHFLEKLKEEEVIF